MVKALRLLNFRESGHLEMLLLEVSVEFLLRDPQKPLLIYALNQVLRS